MNRIRRSLFGMAFAVAVYVPVCVAGDWAITPRLSVSELYSDNILLSPTTQDDDFVTNVTPGLSVRGAGARVDLNADYNLQSLFYLNDDSRDQTLHQLQSNLRVEAVRNRFFVNAFANVFQALVSSNGIVSNDNARLSNNRDDVIVYGVRPEFKHHFGNWADLSATAQFNEVIRDQDRSGAGRGNNFNATLKSGNRFDRVRWSIRYSRRANNNSNGAASNSLENLNSRISYRINRFFSINGSIGTENNNFQSREGANDNGFIWSFGGAFTPSQRTTISGDIGERAFGSTRSFNLSHRHRRISVTANYNESLRTSTEELVNQQLIPLVDAFGNPVFNPDEISNLALPIDSLSLVDEVFLTRNFNATLGYFRKRDTVNFTVFMRDREGRATQADEISTGFNANWRRTISRRLSGGLRFSFRTGNSNQFGNNQSSSQRFLQSGLGRINSLTVNADRNAESDIYFVTPYLSYIIGPSVSTNLSYTFTKSDSDNAANSFEENSLTGALNFAF